eukprot:SAG31_NODE_21380_length_551_cov_0.882743_1_plen_56_part_01
MPFSLILHPDMLGAAPAPAASTPAGLDGTCSVELVKQLSSTECTKGASFGCTNSTD